MHSKASLEHAALWTAADLYLQSIEGKIAIGEQNSRETIGRKQAIQKAYIHGFNAAHSPKSSGHANRGWRNSLERAADQYLESPDGERAIGDPSPKEIDQRRKSMRKAYIDGFMAGKGKERR